MDMKMTVFSYSAPETMLSLVLRKEAGDYLGVPSFNAGGFTDSKEIDQQAGLEVANSLNAAALAGGNLVHDIGYLESGMTSSLELLTIADEEISMIDRFIKSVQVNKDTIGVDEVAKVGPGGNYLTSKGTIDKFKEDVWTPDIIDRNVYDNWEFERVVANSAKFAHYAPNELDLSTAIRDIDGCVRAAVTGKIEGSELV